MAKDSFVFYTQWAEQINMLTDKQAGALFKAVCGYVETGKIKKLDAVTNMLFSVIKSQIDKDTAKYEETCQKRKQAGAKGGRPKAEKQKVFTESKKSKRFFEKAKKADNDNVNDNGDEYVTHIISPINSPNNSVCSSSNAHTCEDNDDDLPSTEIKLFGWRDSKVLMLSDAQFESICESCGLNEVDYYMDRMVELIQKGYKFGCSHYEFILKMVEKDRRVR